MSEASTAARKLADEHNVDLESVEGTGNEGLVTKNDIMAALQANRAVQEASEPSGLEGAEEKVIETASEEDLMALIQSLRSEINELKEGVEFAKQDVDLTDSMFFIAKPGGRRWEERRVIDKRTVAVEFIATKFIGPFDAEEDCQAYLQAKSKKREDAHVEWDGCKIMVGREARALDRHETQEREARFDSGMSTNVLDRRIFHAAHSGHSPGIGKIVGPAA